MSWITRRDLANEMWPNFSRYRVIETVGSVIIEVPPKDLWDAAILLEDTGPCGIRVVIKPLAWWRCWIVRRQFIGIQ